VFRNRLAPGAEARQGNDRTWFDRAGNGDLPEAIRQYESAIATEPTDVGYLLLAQALRLQGRSEEATAISERVAGSSLNLAEAQKAVAAFLSLEGKRGHPIAAEKADSDGRH
jgi:tetratricopeptide (TPR) repeat protein